MKKIVMIICMLITCGICGQKFYKDMDAYRKHNDQHEREAIEAIDEANALSSKEP